MKDTELKKHVLITGANGFIGSHLTRYLRREGCTVRAAVRKDSKLTEGHNVVVGEIDGKTSWPGALQEIDCVVHLAGRAHRMKSPGKGEADMYYRTNTEGTIHLAEEAVTAGVKRFIFISTIKVYGEGGRLVKYRADDMPEPQDDYARSKWEAEQGLRELAEKTGLEVVIIRPPLVYGKGARGNFARLVSWVERGLPVPLKAIKNKRSMVYIGNLCDLISTCIDHPQAAGKTFLVSDGQDVSTAELVSLVGSFLNRPVRLVAIPLFILKFVGSLCGKGKELQRVTESLVVEVSETNTLLGWKPPWSLEQGIARSVL